MTLKSIIPVLMMILCGGNRLHAQEIFFLAERFSYITLTTTNGKEQVVFESYNKMTNKTRTIFRSRLSRVKKSLYRTARGTVFALEHLPAPIINDTNRHVNSGDWRLTVSGKSAEYRRLDHEIPDETDFGTARMVFLGSVGDDPR